MEDVVMIQTNIPICPCCKGALRKILTMHDIVYVCLGYCNVGYKVVDFGQSDRELKCEVIKHD